MQRNLSSATTSKFAPPKKGPGIYKFERDGKEFFEYWAEVKDPGTKKTSLKILGFTQVEKLGKSGFTAMKEFLNDAWAKQQPDAFKSYIEGLKKDGVH